MPLTIYRRKGGKVWHYRGTVDGNLIRRSTGTTDKTTAKRIAAEIEARLWKGRLDGPASILTFAHAAALYIKAEKPTRFIAPLVAYWKETAVKDITAGAIRQSALAIHPNVSGATRNRQVIVPTQAIINHAAEMELCPRIRVKRFPVATRKKDPTSLTWVRAFMSVATPHLGALACFMFCTGARISEALSLTWEECDLSVPRARLYQTKIGAERTVHLPPMLVAAMASIDGPREGRVFKFGSRHNIKTQWESAIRRAGIKRLTPHSCRHGFATAMLQAGVDVVTVAKLGGWASPAHVFATYGHASDDPTLTDRIAGAQDAQPMKIHREVIKKTI